MKLTKKSLANYMDSANKLSDAVKLDIQKNSGKITKNTVLALNKYLVSANDLVDFANRLSEDGSENDPTLQ